MIFLENRHSFTNLAEERNEGLTLSHLLQSYECDGRRWFNDPFVSREQWAFVLGINRATLYRYQAIIRSDRLLSRVYGEGRFSPHQGFVLYLFREIKLSGFYKQWGSKPLWYWITKEKFERWRNEQDEQE